ncbi:MAG: TRAP transporter small permease [Bacillota bacterium]|nr:TRAP transporter small permease [Bacillota bacterium]
MQFIRILLGRINRGLDLLAGLILAFTAGLVVANILGRTLLQRSILGTYEMVGFFTAAAVGLALARCALENSHIAITFIMERVPFNVQRVVELFIGIPVALFLSLAAYHLFQYGLAMAGSGEVSPTTQIIYYPFIYLVAVGFLMLSLTALFRLLDECQEGMTK